MSCVVANSIFDPEKLRLTRERGTFWKQKKQEPKAENGKSLLMIDNENILQLNNKLS